jgi:hypothetical protein
VTLGSSGWRYAVIDSLFLSNGLYCQHISSITVIGTYNLKRTIDPGMIPSLASTIGGPKHFDLIYRVSTTMGR